VTRIAGIWLPFITPFADGAVDLDSYENVLREALAKGITGVFPLGTTGESPVIDDDEMEAIVDRTVSVVSGLVPIFVGVGGNATHKVLKTLKRLERYAFEGIVSVCPYYNRPSQDGLRDHFMRIAESTDREIIIYNIPYRTSVNLLNDTLLRLAEVPNIVGVKDSSGNTMQSLELLRSRPKGFAVMTGEDSFFYTMLAHGADGGILASSHVRTEVFAQVYDLMQRNDHRAAYAAWRELERLIPLLFKEANPMPLKHLLWRQGLLRSAECRLPLTRISAALEQELEQRLPVATRS
jgi:4-hydroxy-tetrahydrodipicolinate synthase